MQSKLTPKAVTGAVFLLLTGPLAAQNSGVSHPESVEGTVTTASPVRAAKPSPDIAADAAQTPVQPDVAAGATETSSEHYTARSRNLAADSDGPVLHTHSASRHDSEPVETASRPATRDRSLEVTEDVNSGIVTEAPTRPGELNSGSLLRARLQTRLSTQDSRIGTVFTARLEQPVERHGEVLLPAGAIVSGRVADVHGGNRLRGGALLRLQPDSVSLPDGTVRPLSADLIDLGNEPDHRVDSEGVVHQKSHPARDLSAAGLATGSGAVAGALVGGGVGAIVGAGIGAGVSTVVWLRHDQQEVLPIGTVLVFSLSEPLSIRASN